MSCPSSFYGARCQHPAGHGGNHESQTPVDSRSYCVAWTDNAADWRPSDEIGASGPSGMTTLDWLADRDDPRVQAALTRKCCVCPAGPKEDCHHPWATTKALGRVVHLARVEP